MKTTTLKLDTLVAHPANPRSELASQPDDVLLASLKAGQHKPVTVRSLGEGAYQIVAGHRTVNAAQQLGMDTIVATIVSMDDQAALRAVIADNTSSRQLTTLGMASALEALGAATPRLSKARWSEISKITGIAKKTAQALMRIASLPVEWCDALEADEVSGTTSGVTAAKSHALLALRAGDAPLSPMPPAIDLVAIARASSTAATFRKNVVEESKRLGRVGDDATPETETKAAEAPKATKAEKAEKVEAAAKAAVEAAPKAGAAVTKTVAIKLDRLAANLEGLRFVPESDVIIARALRKHDGNALRVADAVEVLLSLGVLQAK